MKKEKEEYATYVKYPQDKRFKRVTGRKLTKSYAERVGRMFQNAKYAPNGTKFEVRKVK